MITADLDQQLYGGSIHTIDNNDGCVVCLEEFEQFFVRYCVSGVTIHPPIWPKGEECGVMVTVCVDDGADFEVKQLRFCNGYMSQERRRSCRTGS